MTPHPNFSSTITGTGPYTVKLLSLPNVEATYFFYLQVKLSNGQYSYRSKLYLTVVCGLSSATITSGVVLSAQTVDAMSDSQYFTSPLFTSSRVACSIITYKIYDTLISAAESSVFETPLVSSTNFEIWLSPS